MKVILTKNLDGLGTLGQVVDVKDGYARNYLLPRNLALVANKGNTAVYEEMRRQKQAQQTRAKRTAETLAKTVEKASCTVPAVGEEDRIYGSVTAQRIADLLEEQGIDIDRRSILLEEPIKALGVYDVPIHLHPEVETKIKVWVVRE